MLDIGVFWCQVNFAWICHRQMMGFGGTSGKLGVVESIAIMISGMLAVCVLLLLCHITLAMIMLAVIRSLIVIMVAYGTNVTCTDDMVLVESIR